MSKKIALNSEAKEKMLTGIMKLSEAVTCTLGPNGRNVIIENDGELPSSTKDGVTVAKSITLEDPIENIGAQIVKQAAIKTADLAGDGTTTTTLLASSMIKEGFESITSGSNAVNVKRGIEKASKAVIEELQNIAKNIENEDQIKQIAVISANGDDEIGTLIAEAMKAVGADGVVTVEESSVGTTSLEIVEGIQFDRGYKSLYFVTNNDTMSVTLNNPYILIYNGKLANAKELLPLLEKCSTSDRSLLIIAEDIDGEALSVLLVNKMKGIIKVCAVKAPDFGEKRTHILTDIATLTNAAVVTPEKGMRLQSFDESWLGTARLVNVDKDNTTIIDGAGDAESIENRINSIRTQIDNSKSLFEREKLQERLGKMSGGVAIINIGASTEVEMKEKKDRMDDALHATKAALQEGIVAGGGAALIHASKVLNTEYPDHDLELGRNIFLNACKAPLYKILSNAGYDDAHIFEVFNGIFLQDDIQYGYNLKTDEISNLVSDGIIDPVKVTRLAIENAVSVAGTVLITEAVVYSKEEVKKDEMLNQFM